MERRFPLLLVLIAIGAVAVVADTHAQARTASEILGEWWTEANEGRILFTRSHDGSFRGTATCCRPAHASERNPITDLHNPNPRLRSRSTLGIAIIWELKYDDGEYSGGYVYNPRDGKTYRLEARLVDHDTLRVRGYIGIPLLGQTQIWKRVRSGA